jgi:hypothetical protein
MHSASYILPIRAVSLDGLEELTNYLVSLRELVPALELIIVDDSPDFICAVHRQRWEAHSLYLKPDRLNCPNRKVRGVLTGLRCATQDKVIIADDDVRYDGWALDRMLVSLDEYDIVRPQNYFNPQVWHTVLDSSRSLINRLFGGDWPGTLGVRRSALPCGYNGNVLFENLELVRTVLAGGGRELVAYDIFVARRPPTIKHYLGQRIRQAYDEFARPLRMTLALSVLPLIIALIVFRHLEFFSAFAAIAISVAEAGRNRAGATRYFSILSSVLAPLWIVERGLCAWLALAERFRRGGISYAGNVIRDAATPLRLLTEKTRPRESGSDL